MSERPSFFFVRHGRTEANQRGLMCGGKWDLSLTAEGVAQARVAAEKLLSRQAPVTQIYASPLKRALETANIIAEALQLPVSICDSLQEWDIGDWDRRPFEEVKELFLGNGEPQNGESRALFRARIEKALRESVDLHPNEKVLLVSHGAVWMSLLEILGCEKVRPENCALFEITCQSAPPAKIEKL